MDILPDDQKINALEQVLFLSPAGAARRWAHAD
jgi:hypothetical protein